MILAAYMVVGFLVASIYAVGMLQGRRDRLHRLGLLIPLTIALHRDPDPALRRRHRGARSRRPPAGQVRRHGVHPGDRRPPDRVRRRHLHRRRGQVGDPDPRPRLLPGRLQRRHRGDRARATSRPTSGRRPTRCSTSPSTRWSGSARRCSLLGAWLGLVWWKRRDIPQTPWFLRAVAVSGVGGDRGALVRLDRHRGRPPALDRPGLHADRGSGHRGGRDLVRLRRRAAALRGARDDRDPRPARDVAALARGRGRDAEEAPYGPPAAGEGAA